MYKAKCFGGWRLAKDEGREVAREGIVCVGLCWGVEQEAKKLNTNTNKTSTFPLKNTSLGYRYIHV